jgi:excinuclease UvrABC nuclease subunit
VSLFNRLLRRLIRGRRRTPDPGPTDLYRVYDVVGRLLYVGISTDARRRIRQHRRTKSWAGLLYRVDVERHRTRAEALREEQHVIQTEHPLFNEERYL